MVAVSVRIALLGLLLPLSYVCFYFGLTQPIVSVKSVMGGGIEVTRSTLQSIDHLYNEGFYFPALLILTFSVLVPILKAATIARVLLVFRKNRPKASRLAYHLRVFAKYQLLDIFVALFMVAFLNMEIISTRLERGFLFYFLFCLGSVISAQTLYSLVHGPDLPVIARHLQTRLSSRTPLLAESVLPVFAGQDADSPARHRGHAVAGGVFWRANPQFLLATGSLLVGTALALVRPILTVKVAFEGSLVLSRNTMTLGETFGRLLMLPGASVAVHLAAFLLVVSVLVLPLFAASLAPKRPSLADYLSDWAMADVAALGLFTLLISMNSFGVIVADVPPGLMSGFWFVLMAGMSCLDLTLQCHALAVKAEARTIVQLLDIPSLETVSLLHDQGDNQQNPPPAERDAEWYESEAEALAMVMERPAAGAGEGGVIKTMRAKLSTSVVAMKAVSWGVFFALWFLQSAEKAVDLNTVNAEIRANLPAVTKALEEALPMSIGNCTAAAPQPCQGGNASLYYNRSSMYEVEAQWLSGLKSTRLENIHLSVPREAVFAVEIAGSFGEIPLSLKIAECFTPDVWITGNCRTLWDNTDACCGKNKGFYVLIVADCKPDFPFIRNIQVKSVKVDPIKIEESIAGLVKVPLSDVTETVEAAIQDSLAPTLDQPFIPWGEKNMTLADLINRILLLNVGEDFSCPTPLTQ